jgi:hypothetical protein
MRRKKAAVLMNRRFFQLDLLALIGAIQERHDLAAGAGRIRGKRRLSHAVRDSILNGPSNSLRIVSARRNIREAAHRSDPFLVAVELKSIFSFA